MAISKSLKRSFIMIGVAFLIFFAGMATLLTVGFTNQEDVIDPRYHEKGLLYAQERKKQERAKTEGWYFISDAIENKELRQSNEKAKNELVIELKNKAGVPLEKADMYVIFYFGATTKNSQVVDMKQVEPGKFKGTYHPVKPGYWDLVMKANLNDNAQLVKTQEVLIH